MPPCSSSPAQIHHLGDLNLQLLLSRKAELPNYQHSGALVSCSPFRYFFLIYFVLLSQLQNRWVEMFPSIVARARTIQVITPGLGSHVNGSLQLVMNNPISF